MLQVVQAFDRTPIAEIATDDAAALEAKLSAAQRVFRDREGWLKPHERMAILRRLAGLVEGKRDHLALQIAREGAVRQTKTVSEIAPTRHCSDRAELPPCGQRGGATVLEILPADEAAFLVEVVLDRAMDGGEFLQTSHAPEAEHRPFPSSEWLVGVLSSVVPPTASFTLVDGTQNLERSAVRSQPICHDRLSLAVSPK